MGSAMAQPEKIARAVPLFSLLENDSTTGQVLAADGGFSSLASNGGKGSFQEVT
jgi:hypothetical protein